MKIDTENPVIYSLNLYLSLDLSHYPKTKTRHWPLLILGKERKIPAENTVILNLSPRSLSIVSALRPVGDAAQLRRHRPEYRLLLFLQPHSLNLGAVSVGAAVS